MLCRRKGRAAIWTPPAGAFTLSLRLSHELRQSAVSQGGTHPAALAATLTCVITAWAASRLRQGSPLTHSECFYPQGDRFRPHHHRLQVSVSELQKKNILGQWQTFLLILSCFKNADLWFFQTFCPSVSQILWIHAAYPSCEESTENIGKEGQGVEAKLGRWLDKTSVQHVQANQSHFASLAKKLPQDFSMAYSFIGKLTSLPAAAKLTVTSCVSFPLTRLLPAQQLLPGSHATTWNLVIDWAQSRFQMEISMMDVRDLGAEFRGCETVSVRLTCPLLMFQYPCLCGSISFPSNKGRPVTRFAVSWDSSFYSLNTVFVAPFQCAVTRK